MDGGGLICIQWSHLLGGLGLLFLLLLTLLYFKSHNSRNGLPNPWETPSRTQSTTPGYRYPFTPYATGWFVACESAELRKGRVLPLRLFGEDLVAFRSEKDGLATILDAHCPHLGAHLGYGGKVVGDCIQCPFHAWRFNPQGKCVRIPYCDTIPKGAEIRPWKVLERNGFVLVWYQGGNPDMEPFPVPIVEEVGNSDWSHFKLKWTNRVHLQEMAENALDLAHLNVVHFFDEKPEIQKFRVKDQKFHVKMTSPRRLLWFRDLVRIKIAFFGMGLVHAKTDMRYISLRILITHTPIDEEHCQVRMHVRFRKNWNFLRTLILRAYLPFHIGSDYYSDINIWERKIYKKKALLCRGDGPVNAVRRWSKQFYLSSGIDESLDF